MRFVALMLFATASVGPAVVAAPVPKAAENPDLAAMQGKWTLTGIVLDEDPLPAEAVAASALTLEVSGATFVTVAVRSKLRMTATAKLDATVTPRRITFGEWKSTDLDGKPRDNPNSMLRLGIYKFEGGAFVLASKCDDKDPAPAVFGANPGSKTCVMTFTRVKN